MRPHPLLKAVRGGTAPVPVEAVPGFESPQLLRQYDTVVTQYQQRLLAINIKIQQVLHVAVATTPR